MDGKYLDRGELFNWISENISSVSPLLPVTIHMTDLYKGLSQPEVLNHELFDISLMVFQNLVSEIKRIGNTVKTGLVIPLNGTSKKLSLKIPTSRADIFTQLTNEPPSLWMESWDTLKKAVVVEEFRTPFNIAILNINDSHFYAYYREHRYWMAIDNNWEFERGLYIEYYPNGRLFT